MTIPAEMLRFTLGRVGLSEGGLACCVDACLERAQSCRICADGCEMHAGTREHGQSCAKACEQAPDRLVVA